MNSMHIRYMAPLNQINLFIFFQPTMTKQWKAVWLNLLISCDTKWSKHTKLTITMLVLHNDELLRSFHWGASVLRHHMLACILMWEKKNLGKNRRFFSWVDCIIWEGISLQRKRKSSMPNASKILVLLLSILFWLFHACKDGYHRHIIQYIYDNTIQFKRPNAIQVITQNKACQISRFSFARWKHFIQVILKMMSIIMP